MVFRCSFFIKTAQLSADGKQRAPRNANAVPVQQQQEKREFMMNTSILPPSVPEGQRSGSRRCLAQRPADRLAAALLPARALRRRPSVRTSEPTTILYDQPRLAHPRTISTRPGTPGTLETSVRSGRTKPWPVRTPSVGTVTVTKPNRNGAVTNVGTGPGTGLPRAPPRPVTGPLGEVPGRNPPR